MGSYTQGGRFVSGLALAPRPVNRTAACQRGVHRWHAVPGVSVGQGRGPCHPGVSGQRAASSRGAFGRRLVRGARSGPSWRVEVEEGTRTGGRLRHPQPWAFLVLAPGLRQGWPSWCGDQRPVRGPPSCGTTRAHVLRRCMPIDRGVMAPFGVYDHAPVARHRHQGHPLPGLFRICHLPPSQTCL